MTWLIDFVGYNSKNSPPIKVSLQVLNILQVGREVAWHGAGMSIRRAALVDRAVQPCAGKAMQELKGTRAKACQHRPQQPHGLASPTASLRRTTSRSALAALCPTGRPPSSTSFGAPCPRSSTPSPATSLSSSPPRRL